MKSVMRVILVNAVVVFAILLGLEAGSRVVKPVDLPDPLITRHREGWMGIRLSDPLLFWRMRPDISKQGISFTNSLGLRGDEIPPKAADEFRILSLGESTTFAGRLALEQSYSGLLQHGLGSVGGKRLRVINAGVPGYTLFQGVTYLRLHGFALQPDAVMTYFGFNDFLPVSFRVSRDANASSSAIGMTDREMFQYRNTLRYRFVHALQQNSNLVRIILQGIAPTGAEVKAGHGPRVPEDDRRWLYAELRRLCRDNGTQLIVLIP